MTPESKVYIVGVGFSPSPSTGSIEKDVVVSLVSAATKAFLDAGVTFDDVSLCVTSVRSKTPGQVSKVFRIFNDGEINHDEVEKGSELSSTIHRIEDRGNRCVLTIAVEKSATIAFILVSDLFLWSRPYLKDSAALIRQSDKPPSKSEGQASEGLWDICQIVWTLRGWSAAQDTAAKDGHFYYQNTKGQCFELSCADLKAIPEWKDVEYKQDGKHRLGYNPAAQSREISQEDLEAVRASGSRRNEASDQVQFVRKGGDRAALSKL